jgi:hypothetical protein
LVKIAVVEKACDQATLPKSKLNGSQFCLPKPPKFKRFSMRANWSSATPKVGHRNSVFPRIVELANARFRKILNHIKQMHTTSFNVEFISERSMKMTFNSSRKRFVTKNSSADNAPPLTTIMGFSPYQTHP